MTRKSKKTRKNSPTPRQQLRDLRREIAALDAAFLDVFAHYLNRRQALAKLVGSVKKSARLPIRDASVEAAVEKRFVARIGKLLDVSFARRVARAIMKSSRRQQTR